MIKRYKCQFPKCDKEIQIRTKIKNPDSEYFGLNVPEMTNLLWIMERNVGRYILNRTVPNG